MQGGYVVVRCACVHVCVMDSHSSGMVEGRAVVGVGMSVSETRFLNKLSLDLVAIMVVKMAPYIYNRR